MNIRGPCGVRLPGAHAWTIEWEEDEPVEVIDIPVVEDESLPPRKRAFRSEDGGQLRAPDSDDEEVECPNYSMMGTRVDQLTQCNTVEPTPLTDWAHQA